MDELKKIVEHQSNISQFMVPGRNPTFAEAMLQFALLHLHAVIEGDQDLAEKIKKKYWNLGTSELP